jgi:hypothetical protein
LIGWFVLLRRILALGTCPVPSVSAVVLLLFALPIPFALDRGNIEVFVGMLVAYSVIPAVAVRSGRTTRVWPIIVAGFLKISPIVMLALVRWRRGTAAQAVLAGTACVIASILSLLLVDGSPVASARALVDLTTRIGESGFDPFVFRSSAWGTVASYSAALGFGADHAVPSGVYSLALIALAAVVAAVLPLHLWERIAMVGAAMVLLSADAPAYRLLYLLIGAAVFVAVCWFKRSWYSCLMAVLLAGGLSMKPWVPELPWFWTLVTGTALTMILCCCAFAGVVRLLSLRRRF